MFSQLHATKTWSTKIHHNLQESNRCQACTRKHSRVDVFWLQKRSNCRSTTVQLTRLLQATQDSQLGKVHLPAMILCALDSNSGHIEPTKGDVGERSALPVRNMLRVYLQPNATIYNRKFSRLLQHSLKDLVPKRVVRVDTH